MEVIDHNWDFRVPQETIEYLKKLNPVFSVEVDNVAILKIWKNERKYYLPIKK